MRWADIPGPFPGTGSVSTFLLLGSRLLIMRQLDYNSERAVFSVWFTLKGYKQDEVWRLVTMTLTKDRPVLLSERAPHNNKTVIVKQQ
jgi:hypothetical protein